MQESSPTITLFTGQSPNGVKISITLEELGLPYNVRTLDMKINEQKSDWFTKTNPNGRIPAITDIFNDGSEIRVFESGSIMQYLVGRYDTDYKISYPPGTREHVEVCLAGRRHLRLSNVFVDDELAFLSKCRSGTNVIKWVRYLSMIY
jgi:glutathione S-transferase